MNRKSIDTMAGSIEVKGVFASWKLTVEQRTPIPDTELIRLRLESPEPASPPHLVLSWSIPKIDMQISWCESKGFSHNIPPNWCGYNHSTLVSSLPLQLLAAQQGENRFLFAVSETLRPVGFKAGVREEDNRIECSVELFREPEAPIRSCQAELRFDFRKIFYADAIRDAMEWFAAFPECIPSLSPPAAFEPFYSSWYSYHQNISDRRLEAECAVAREYGLKGLIVDDGWQTDDTGRSYAFCGDWEVSAGRFPDMKAHVKKIHELGMKYLLWFPLPFIGDESRNRSRFQGKFLYRISHSRVSVLDPRFPEIREFLAAAGERVLREWELDGFKFDFIDNFCFQGEDPAVAEHYAGRDIRSLPAAVDRLLSDIMIRLKAIRPELLIEFRQSYIGPALRKYGNMFRASDCPGDVLGNRASTLRLRLTSGETAVHSDMLEWAPQESPEEAALQLLNVLFSVPQISVRLAELPESHRKMLRFWLNFWREHRTTLLSGRLKPLHPEQVFPQVSAETETEKIIAVYAPDQAVAVRTGGGICHIVNASNVEEMTIELDMIPAASELFNALGEVLPSPHLTDGPQRLHIPRSGLLKIHGIQSTMPPAG